MIYMPLVKSIKNIGTSGTSKVIPVTQEIKALGLDVRDSVVAALAVPGSEEDYALNLASAFINPDVFGAHAHGRRILRHGPLLLRGCREMGAVRIGSSPCIREAVRRTAQLHERLLGRRAAASERHIRRGGKVLRSRPPGLISSAGYLFSCLMGV